MAEKLKSLADLKDTPLGAATEALEHKSGQAYHVIGFLLNFCGLFGSDEGERALDYFGTRETSVEEDFLPWPRHDVVFPANVSDALRADRDAERDYWRDMLVNYLDHEIAVLMRRAENARQRDWPIVVHESILKADAYAALAKMLRGKQWQMDLTEHRHAPEDDELTVKYPPVKPLSLFRDASFAIEEEMDRLRAENAVLKMRLAKEGIS